ncbi:hypothetical protein [Lysinibacillus sphaericus]
MVKKFKRTAKKVVLAAKQAAKKTSTKVKQAVKEVKAKVKETVVPLKPSKGKVEKISKKVGNKIQGEAELAKFFDEYLKDRKTVGPIGNKYSVQDGNPLTTLQDKQRVLGGGNHSRTKKSTAVDQFIYSLLIEDYVTLVDPKATLGEKALAGLSMVPIFKPVKAVDAAYDTAKIYNKTRVIENVNDSKKIRASSNFNNYKNKEKEVLENIKNSAKKVEVTEQDSKQLAEYAKSLDKGTGNGVGNFVGKINADNIPNMTKNDILEGLPSNWKHTENNGFVHIRDANGNVRMKIDPPDKVTKYDHVHIFDESGNPLDVNLNVVDRKSPDAHIPYKK